MIILLTGDNSYEIDAELKRLVAEFEGVPEKFDGSGIELRQLPDLLMGLSLFATKRLVVIRGLSANKQVWDALPEWLERLSDDIELVLVEPKPDKRTRSYKALQKVASVREYKSWTERDTSRAEKWVEEQSRVRGMTLPSALRRFLVARVGVNQWELVHALDKLSLLDEVSQETIRDTVDARPSESVFDLFETALKGDRARIQEMVATLALSEDPYQLFGLLSGQAFQFAALTAAHEGDDVARDIGAHPFVLSRLRPYAEKRGASGARQIVRVFAEADETMKTSPVDPWLAIERALLQIAA